MGHPKLGARVSETNYMNKVIRKIAALLLLLSSSLPASSLTFLIDTRDSVSRDEMDIEEKKKVVSLESGVMDGLFEGGHIFFNMYSPKEENAEEQTDKILKYAGEIGAGYLIVLFPEESGSAWSCYRVDGSLGVADGFLDIEDTNPQKSIMERWTSLGSSLVETVIPLIN